MTPSFGRQLHVWDCERQVSFVDADVLIIDTSEPRNLPPGDSPSAALDTPATLYTLSTAYRRPAVPDTEGDCMTDTPSAASGAHPTWGPLRFAESPGTYVAVAVLLLAAMVALLWVPSYVHLTPTFIGIPFFYWYSILWLLINAACQFAAYRLLVSAKRRARLAGGEAAA